MINKFSISIGLANILFFCSCNSTSSHTVEYVAIYKRDTAYLTLQMYETSYHGTLEIHGRGTDKEFGSVQGNIEGDTLLGDFLYKPYKAKLEKRRPLVLLRRENTLIQGSGSEQVYMGISYYSPKSIHFDNPKFVFKKSKIRY